MNRTTDPLDCSQHLIQRQLRAGWIGLLIYLSVGIGLEVLHGLKVDFYLDLRNEPRRMLWTLAHTHGTLLSLIGLAFAWTLTQRPARFGLRTASALLIAGQVLLPAGFFLGGIWLHGGDPNLLILLVPCGALAVFLGVLLTAYSVSFASPTDAAEKQPASGKSPVRGKPQAKLGQRS